MVLLCFLYVEIALNFRWTSAGRSRKCGIACCRVPLNQTHPYCNRRSQERLDFGALPLWLSKRRVCRAFLFDALDLDVIVRPCVPDTPARQTCAYRFHFKAEMTDI